jgi:hypothetical protein
MMFDEITSIAELNYNNYHMSVPNRNLTEEFEIKSEASDNGAGR